LSSPLLHGDVVYGLDRCPQCGVATPLVSSVSKPKKHYKDGHENTWWHFTGECSRCHRHILFYGWTNSDESPRAGNDPSNVRIRNTYPELETASDEIPDKAKRFLQQALESKHAPDGALMLAASSIDAMLKEKGFKSGTLYSRIEKAYETGLLTEQMRDWAHETRLSANEPRHADDDFEGATPEDAQQVIEFAKALAEYLFVLPARVKRWKATASPPS
jgi:hypothetical protein